MHNLEDNTEYIKSILLLSRRLHKDFISRETLRSNIDQLISSAFKMLVNSLIFLLALLIIWHNFKMKKGMSLSRRQLELYTKNIFYI